MTACDRCGTPMPRAHRPVRAKFCHDCRAIVTQERTRVRQARWRATPPPEDPDQIERRYTAALAHLKATQRFTLDPWAGYSCSLPTPPDEV